MPSRVKTGSVSANRPSVTSNTWPSAIRASRSRRSGLGARVIGCSAGCDHASQAESGDQASPVTTPLSDAAIWRTWPDSTSTSRSRPSCAATATALPSGAAASPVMRPTWPTAMRRGPVAGSAGPAGSPEPISRASLPSASVAHTTCPPVPSTCGNRARAPGTTDTAERRSRWVSQCTVPRTSIELARPPWSTDSEPMCSSAVTRRGARPPAGEPRVMSSRTGPAACRSSSSHSSPPHA